MNRPTAVQIEWAERLLAHEATPESAVGAGATAAGRVYDKLHEHIAPLLGDAGVQLLFVRSARLAEGEFASLAQVSILEGSTRVRERLKAHELPVATESAAALFANFFALLATFIGERLTAQVLRRAWPTIEGAGPRGTEP